MNISESTSGSPTLPQVTEKPKTNIAIPEKEPFNEEELRKLKVNNVDVTSSYYVNRERLQVNVRRVILSEVNEQLAKNAYIYLIVSLLPEKSAFYESELRPVAEENYFEEASEFDVLVSEVSSRPLKIAIYACDRFSQHRLVKEYTYEMSVDYDENAEPRPSILPVKMEGSVTSANSEV